MACGKRMLRERRGCACVVSLVSRVSDLLITCFVFEIFKWSTKTYNAFGLHHLAVFEEGNLLRTFWTSID